MMNPAAEKLLGVSKKDKIGQNVLEGAKEEQLISMVRDSSAEEAKVVAAAAGEQLAAIESLARGAIQLSAAASQLAP